MNLKKKFVLLFKLVLRENDAVFSASTRAPLVKGIVASKLTTRLQINGSCGAVETGGYELTCMKEATVATFG